MFTPEELAELAAFDAMIDEDDSWSKEDAEISRSLDLQARRERMDPTARRRAERAKAYYEANKDQIAERAKAYYEANKDQINRKRRERYAKNCSRVC